MQNRPRARKTFVSGGSSSNHSGSHGGGHGGRGGYGSRGAGGGRGGGLIKIIILVVLLLGGGGGALGGGLGNLFGGQDFTSLVTSGSGTQSGWLMETNSGRLNTKVSSDARAKYTNIKGLGKDKVTLMLYMCGTDLESRAGMATSDLNEMLSADISDNVNLIVYTGGCSGWKNSKVSSRVNQIWQIKNEKLICLDKNAGTGAMTDPATLTSFIKWTKKNYPANRNELILWDHGGGSISGYGYDEKNKYSGSMTLAGIDKALTAAGVKFDFVGFDACLMATAETALMLNDHADYMIASEETEPGIGWFYTNWLSELSADTSMETIQLGKRICDDFTDKCAARCPGQQTTLSVVDLAEASCTIPSTLKKFSAKSSDMIEDGSFQNLAQARSGSREFARSSGIDQIDLAHFAKLMDISQGDDLAQSILDSVKYNKTSANISNSYGLSIYFPFRKVNKVDTISKTYKEIGMDKEYTSCIKRFAQMQVSGQAVAGGTQSPLQSLLGSAGNGSSGGNSNASNSSASSGSGISDLLTSGQAQSLLTSIFSGGRSINQAGIDELDASNSNFMSDENSLDPKDVAEYVTEHRISGSDLDWKENSDGDKVIQLSEEKWKMVSSVDMNLFYDNGKGFLDFGLDNVYDFDSEGNLLPKDTGTWLALNGQVVTYYHDDTQEMGGDAYQITGHVPAKVNGVRADLILTFDNENEQGRISGLRYDYNEKVTDTQAKSKTELEAGDRIQFLYDYYTYNGKHHQDTAMGRILTVRDPEDIEITNENVGSGKSKITYKFTDLFGEEYWSEELK